MPSTLTDSERATDIVLEASQIGVSFQTETGRRGVVAGVDLTIARGEMVALVGESGSGKSVTARAIMGLLPRKASLSDATRIALNGIDIQAHTEPQLRALRGRTMAMIFQEPMSSLNPVYTLGQQMFEAMGAHQRVRRKDAIARAIELFEEVGLPDPAGLLQKYPHQISGGQRQRVMIAMALSNKPDLLIADEPTTALDVIVQAQILELIKALQIKYQMAVLLITHDLTIVRRYSERTYVMTLGEIVETGRTAEVFAKPRHAYTQKLLAAEPTQSARPVAQIAPPPVMVAERITVSYPKPSRGFAWLNRTSKAAPFMAVNEVCAGVHAGEAVGLVGESGSGKTSFGLALMRLISHQSGEIQFEGRRIDNLSRQAMQPVRKRMQIVLQDPFSSLNPRMSARQIVEEGLIIHKIGASQSARAKLVEAAVRDAGLPLDCLSRFPHEFSGGQRQRLAIARAIAVDPSFLVLDEPTSALDLSIQAQIIELLTRLQMERQLSYLFISHDLRVVRALCQRIIIMRSGQIVEQGPTLEVLANPRSDYAKRLIEAAFHV